MPENVNIGLVQPARLRIQIDEPDTRLTIDRINGLISDAFEQALDGRQVGISVSQRDDGSLDFVVTGDDTPSTAGGGPVYAFYTRPALTVPAEIRSATIVPAVGDGPMFTLLDQHVTTGPILPDVDFVTEWFGGFNIEFNNNTNLAVLLHTRHQFGDNIDFDHVREVRHVIRSGEDIFVDLGEFSNVSAISLGTYTPPGGSPIEITEAHLAGESRITYAIELQTLTGRGARESRNITHLGWHDPQTRSYQIDNLRTGATGGVNENAINALFERDLEAAVVDNTETGLSVTFANGKLNFVLDPNIPNAPEVMDLITAALANYAPVDSTARASAAAAQATADAAHVEILDNAVTLAEVKAATRDLHAVDYPGTWETATDAKILVTTAVPPRIRALVPAAGAWATATASFTQAIPSNLRDTLVFVQLPAGESKSNYRVLRENTGPQQRQPVGHRRS